MQINIFYFILKLSHKAYSSYSKPNIKNHKAYSSYSKPKYKKIFSIFF